MSTIKIKLDSFEVHTDPETVVYNVSIEGEHGGEWRETCNSPRDVHFFFLGIKALASFAQLNVEMPEEIPQKISM